MATKKAKNKLQAAFDACPYITTSKFEIENFDNVQAPGRARFVIDSINRIRKIDSDLATETRQFEQAQLQEERLQLESQLDAIGEDKIVEFINNRESTEQEYWVNYLGKQAAIEVLTLGKPSLETLTKLVKLPEDAYISSTQLCVRLANTIRAATVKAEEAIGLVQQQETDTPTKLSLKKVK